jgi:fructose-1,6-bisphosphatase I
MTGGDITEGCIMIDLRQYFMSQATFEEQSFGSVVIDIADAAGIMHGKIQRLGLGDDIGSLGRVNVQGEEVQKLDEVATQVFLDALAKGGKVAVVGCEERSDPVFLGQDRAPYVVNMDPIDGSSNIEVAVGIGSIFGIWPNTGNPGTTANVLLSPGKSQIAALYVVYGSNMVLVLASAAGVRQFSFDPDANTFVLTKSDMQFPQKCQYYSVNYGNWKGYSASFKGVVLELQAAYSLRYVGSLVADFHRNLLKGGVFLYPEDVKNPSGKLRLTYEANPLAFITEKAGGLSSSGHEPILDITPQTLHQRTSLILGHATAMKAITPHLKD